MINKLISQSHINSMKHAKKKGELLPPFPCTDNSYLRNKPTNTNKATNPAKPDSPNLFMISVRLPITLTPKTPVPKITSDMAPMATKDINR